MRGHRCVTLHRLASGFPGPADQAQITTLLNLLLCRPNFSLERFKFIGKACQLCDLRAVGEHGGCITRNILLRKWARSIRLRDLQRPGLEAGPATSFSGSYARRYKREGAICGSASN